MKTLEEIETEVVTDVVCDICRLTRRVDGGGLQFATLQTRWGYGTKHNGERYELHLCESCFFQTVANIRQDRRSQNLFRDDAGVVGDNFGLVVKSDSLDS